MSEDKKGKDVKAAQSEHQVKGGNAASSDEAQNSEADNTVEGQKNKMASDQAQDQAKQEANHEANHEAQNDGDPKKLSTTPNYNYDHLDKAGIPPAISIILYSLLCGAMLVIFSIIQDITKYIFSLIALYAGFKFFQKFDETKHRVIFIVLSIALYFAGFLMFMLYAISNEWHIPGVTDRILEE